MLSITVVDLWIYKRFLIHLLVKKIETKAVKQGKKYAKQNWRREDLMVLYQNAILDASAI